MNHLVLKTVGNHVALARQGGKPMVASSALSSTGTAAGSCKDSSDHCVGKSGGYRAANAHNNSGKSRWGQN